VNEKNKKIHSYLLNNESFFPIDTKSYPLLQKYNYGSLLQEKNITTYVAWQNTFFGLYKIINDCLCAVFFHEGRDIYWTIHRPKENAIYPLQPVIDILFEYCKKVSLPFLRIKFIDKDLVDEYEAVTGYTIQTAYYNNDREYAYKIKDLAELQGTANYYKRKRVKKLTENKDISVELITNNNVKLLPEIENEWCSLQDCSTCRAFYGCEKEAIEVLLEIFNDKIHHGLYIFDNNKPAGYIISEKISDKISFLYFGKSIIQDGFLFLIYKMYSEYTTDSEYMNINEDMGHEGLRKFKKMLSPYELWKKYMVTYSKNMPKEEKI